MRQLPFQLPKNTIKNSLVNSMSENHKAKEIDASKRGDLHNANLGHKSYQDEEEKHRQKEPLVQRIESNKDSNDAYSEQSHSDQDDSQIVRQQLFLRQPSKSPQNQRIEQQEDQEAHPLRANKSKSALQGEDSEEDCQEFQSINDQREKQSVSYSRSTKPFPLIHKPLNQSITNKFGEELNSQANTIKQTQRNRLLKHQGSMSNEGVTEKNSEKEVALEDKSDPGVVISNAHYQLYKQSKSKAALVNTESRQASNLAKPPLQDQRKAKGCSQPPVYNYKPSCNNSDLGKAPAKDSPVRKLNKSQTNESIGPHKHQRSFPAQGQEMSVIRGSRQQQYLDKQSESSQIYSRNKSQSNFLSQTEHSIFNGLNFKDESNLMAASFFNQDQINQRDEGNQALTEEFKNPLVEGESPMENQEAVNLKQGEVTQIDEDVDKTPEELGLIVKRTIETAKLGQLVLLPEAHIKITDLVIDKPITIKGKPGTTLEVTQGSIIIDFQKQENNKEVGVICECDIVFSDRTNQIVFKEELDKEYPEENSPKKSQHLTNSKYKIPLLELSPNLAHQASISESCGLYSLFQIRNFTYVEIRDCNLTSKNKQQVMDAAFVMNEKEYYDSYKGILSVKSCKIQNFSIGFMAGPSSILSIELSYITDCRSSAFICNNPKLFKLSGTVIENVECRGVDLCFRNQNSNQQANSLLSPKTQKENIRKVSIEDNKIQNCKESAIIIHGSALSLDDPNFTTQEQTQLIIKLYKNRIYFNKDTGILLKKLHVISIEVHNCDLFGNEQNGILLTRVLQRRAEDMVVTKCRFSESQVGVVAKDCCFLTISECEFVKNKKTGLLLVDTSSQKWGQSRKQVLRGSFNQNCFNERNNPIVSTGQVAQTEWIAEEREENIVNRNFTTGPTNANPRLNQRLVTSTLLSLGGPRPEHNSSLNNNLNLNTLPNNNQLVHTSTMPNTQNVTPLRQLSKQTKPSDITVGQVKVSKCKISEQREQGVHIVNIYQKTVELFQCVIKENFYNGVCIAQDLDSEADIRKHLQTQNQDNISLDKALQSEQENNNSSCHQFLNPQKYLIMRKDIVQNAKVVLNKCEIQLNKHHGVEVGYVRTSIVNCLIRENMQGAIKMANQNMKLLLKITDDMSRGKPKVKGKVGGEWGEISNPIKELQGASTEHSELANPLNDDDSFAFVNKKGSNVASCCGSTPKKRSLQSLGDYVVVTEYRKDVAFSGQRNQSRSIFGGCMTSRNNSSNGGRLEKNSKSECTIM